MTIYDKQTWMQAFTGNVRRPGADRLLAWLEGTDFFTAPASTRFHGSFPGGLCHHSVNVWHRLLQLRGTPGRCARHAPVQRRDRGSLRAAARCLQGKFLQHRDAQPQKRAGPLGAGPLLCGQRKVVYGHGEKSVFLIERFLRLTAEEAVAIRFHMGAFDDSTRNAYAQAAEQVPLAFWLHTAD